MLTLKDIRARVVRLERLGIGLAKELSQWKEYNHPLTTSEYKAYVDAMRKAYAAIDEARVNLAKAKQRLQIVSSSKND